VLVTRPRPTTLTATAPAEDGRIRTIVLDPGPTLKITAKNTDPPDIGAVCQYLGVTNRGVPGGVQAARRFWISSASATDPSNLMSPLPEMVH
jgi:hypothetical protein